MHGIPPIRKINPNPAPCSVFIVLLNRRSTAVDGVIGRTGICLRSENCFLRQELPKPGASMVVRNPDPRGCTRGLRGGAHGINFQRANIAALPTRPIRGIGTALSVTAIRAKLRPAIPASTHLRNVPVVVGALLFLLLIFTTATVFVRAAWALQAFQIGIYALVAGYLLVGIRGEKQVVARDRVTWLVYLIPLWGVVEIILQTTSSTFETRKEILRWGALAGVFFLSQIVARSSAARRIMLSVMLYFATAMAVLCLLQLFTSEGRVLWMFPTGYPDVYATFPNHSNYAQFAELALPIALWRTLREGRRSWSYPLAGGVIYASVIGAASRAGCATVHGRANPYAGYRLGSAAQGDDQPSFSSAPQDSGDDSDSGHSFHAGCGMATCLGAVCNRGTIFRSLAVPCGGHPYGRASGPLTGFGLGTFPEVYQKYAIKDFPFYANHAHNDWAEFAADGGIPFLLLVLIPFAVAVPIAVREPMGNRPGCGDGACMCRFPISKTGRLGMDVRTPGDALHDAGA